MLDADDHDRQMLDASSSAVERWDDRTRAVVRAAEYARAQAVRETLAMLVALPRCLRRRWLGLGLIAVGGVLGAHVAAETAAPGVVAVTPTEMKWTSQGALAAPGLEQINLVGDPAKPGPYTLRLKFPKGFRIGPHTHPDSREITILSGVYATGYGPTFDAANLKTLPAGSFYTEPANIPHYIEIKEDVVLQVSGTGPSGRRFVNPPDGSK